jgi:hypothetical protein
MFNNTTPPHRNIPSQEWNGQIANCHLALSAYPMGGNIGADPLAWRQLPKIGCYPRSRRAGVIPHSVIAVPGRARQPIDTTDRLRRPIRERASRSTGASARLRLSTARPDHFCPKKVHGTGIGRKPTARKG